MSKSRAVFRITQAEKRKIIKDRLRKENFKKSIYTYRSCLLYTSDAADE